MHVSQCIGNITVYIVIPIWDADYTCTYVTSKFHVMATLHICTISAVIISQFRNGSRPNQPILILTLALTIHILLASMASQLLLNQSRSKEILKLLVIPSVI